MNPRFAATLATLGLLVMIEAVTLGRLVVKAYGGHRRHEQVNREWRALQAGEAALPESGQAGVDEELARADRTLASLRRALSPPGPMSEALGRSGVPRSRSEAFFEIATFVEQLRTRAQQCGVLVNSDERFGFASYRHEAPEISRIPAVFRERIAVQYLLEALLDAKPHQLLAVQRMLPPKLPGERDRTPAGTLAGRAEPDYFRPDEARWPQAPGVESIAIRIAFTGPTPALRGFLNRLAKNRLPVVVSAVEVAPADRAGGGVAAIRAGGTPLVVPPWSRFTVTVEVLALVPVATS